IGVAVAGRHVLRLAALAVAIRHHEQVLPLVLDVAVPVAIEELGEDLGLDRVLLGLFLPLLVGGVAVGVGLLRILGVDSGDERDPFAVARPDGIARLGGDVGQLVGLPAV